MKKLLCLLLSAVLIFCMTSCKSPEKITDYNNIYYNYLQDNIVPEIGVKNGEVPNLKINSFDWDTYKSMPGLAFAFVEDLNGDEIPDLITGEETESKNFFDNKDTKNSTLTIKAYTFSEGNVVFLDKTETSQLLPLFSFVDITLKDKNIIVSGIGAWAGDPPFNTHYIISLNDSSFVQDIISSIDFYTWGGYDNMKDDEKKNVDMALQKLQDFGFGYERIDDLTGKFDPSAKRIAFYSLFGNEGRTLEFFDGSQIPGKGFHDYTNAGENIIK